MTTPNSLLMILLQPYDESGLPPCYWNGVEWMECPQPVKYWDGAAWKDTL